MINDCAHPNYKPQLKCYFERPLKLGGHTPHKIGEALSWHENYFKKGNMRNLE